MLLALVLAFLPLLAPAADNPPTITPAEAVRHVGELVIVQGTVDQVSVSTRGTTYLNFGGRYPDHVFAAVIFKTKQELFPNAKAYEGKTARVRGVVQLYFEKPEIVLNEPAQLSSPE